jgi:cytochrome c-type biogenesis protein CcmH/NrfG
MPRLQFRKLNDPAFVQEWSGKAERLLRDSVEENADDIDRRRALALVQFLGGKYRAAAENFGAVLAKAPHDKEAAQYFEQSRRLAAPANEE